MVRARVRAPDGLRSDLFNGLTAILIASLFSDCAGLQAGPQKKGVALDAEGQGASTPEAVAQAEGRAVSELIDLFVSSTTRAAKADLLEKDFLSSPRAYVRSFKILSKTAGSGGAKVVVRSLVSVDKLAKGLEDAGLVRPSGLFGRPKILISLKEAGPGAGRDVGMASDMLRRQLAARGFLAQDYSDRLNPKHQSTGSRAEAVAAAKAAGAGVLLTGTAFAEPAPDDRPTGYQSYRGRVSARALEVFSGAALGDIAAEATAVDLSAVAAAVKALENAGDSAADKLAGLLEKQVGRRSEMSVAVYGLGGVPGALGFVRQVRALPGVEAAAVSGLAAKDMRLRIFALNLSTDDLASLFLRMPGRSMDVRSVDTDYNLIELENAPQAASSDSRP
jgi:hypothetical protein